MKMVRAAEEPFAQWGAFDILYASPEAVAAALGLPHILHTKRSAQHGNEDTDADDPSSMDSGSPGTAAASTDVWSLGLVLFEAAAATPYWPPHFELFEIVQALLGFTSLPHEANPHMLDACGELAPVVGRMLARDPLLRPTLLEIGELAGNCVMDALVGFGAKEVRSTHTLAWLSAAMCVPGTAVRGGSASWSVTDGSVLCCALWQRWYPVAPGCRSNSVTVRAVPAASAQFTC